MHEEVRHIAHVRCIGETRIRVWIDAAANSGLGFEMDRWFEVHYRVDGASWYGASRYALQLTGATDASSTTWSHHSRPLRLRFSLQSGSSLLGVVAHHLYCRQGDCRAKRSSEADSRHSSRSTCRSHNNMWLRLLGRVWGHWGKPELECGYARLPHKSISAPSRGWFHSYKIWVSSAEYRVADDPRWPSRGIAMVEMGWIWHEPDCYTNIRLALPDCYRKRTSSLIFQLPGPHRGYSRNRRNQLGRSQIPKETFPGMFQLLLSFSTYDRPHRDGPPDIRRTGHHDRTR